MRWMKWISLAASAAMVIYCFNTWVVVTSKNIVVTGMDASAISMGKPGFLHIIFTSVFVVLTFIPKVWAKRLNLPITALNLAWAIRNYFVIAACSWGECPEKHTALYLLMPLSLIILISSLFPDYEINKQPAGK